jgi:imidazoleglycerol phosphate dehydratase HisB
MAERCAVFERQTKETEIRVEIELDGRGEARIDCPLGFFTHMLETLARHSGMNLTVTAKGDTWVDAHHLVEDTGLVLGEALRQALGDCRGIERCGWALMPMDDALAQVAVDLGGRSYLLFEAELGEVLGGHFPASLSEDFFRAFSQGARANLAMRLLCGRSDHHKVEALFKGLARSLKAAVRIDLLRREEIPSTKGVIA